MRFMSHGRKYEQVTKSTSLKERPRQLNEPIHILGTQTLHNGDCIAQPWFRSCVKLLSVDDRPSRLDKRVSFSAGTQIRSKVVSSW